MYYQKSSQHVVVKKYSHNYKLFRWSLGVVDAWLGAKGKYVEKYTYGTTLKHYRWVPLLYMPLIVLSNLALYIWIFASLFVIPILVGGVAKYALFLVVLVLLGVILMALGRFISIWAASDNSILELIVLNVCGIRPERVKRGAIGPLGLFKRWLTFQFSGINPNVTFAEREPDE